jgi:hypothetical protein
VPELARGWAERYRADGTFPEPELSAVGPGTLVFTNEVSDLGPVRIVEPVPPGGDLADPDPVGAVRLYLVRALLDGVHDALGRSNIGAVRAAFEAHIAGSAWGALALTLQAPARARDTLAAVQARLGGVMANWDALDTLRYVAATRSPISLAELVEPAVDGLLDLWLPARSGDPRRDIPRALAAAGQADRNEQLAAWLAALARVTGRLRHADQLTDPARLRTILAGLDPDSLESLSTGSLNAARTVLHAADRGLDLQSD